MLSCLVTVLSNTFLNFLRGMETLGPLGAGLSLGALPKLP